MFNKEDLNFSEFAQNWIWNNIPNQDRQTIDYLETLVEFFYTYNSVIQVSQIKKVLNFFLRILIAWEERHV